MRWTLHKDFLNYLGDSNDPCMFCLATNGCKLLPVKNSYGKSYIASDKSCLNGRYMKMSMRSVDVRRTKKFNSSKRAQNIWSNRPVLCRLPGCGEMH